MGYVIGKKLLNFLDVAEPKPECRDEVPKFMEQFGKTSSRSK